MSPRESGQQGPPLQGGQRGQELICSGFYISVFKKPLLEVAFSQLRMVFLSHHRLDL